MVRKNESHIAEVRRLTGLAGIMEDVHGVRKIENTNSGTNIRETKKIMKRCCYSVNEGVLLLFVDIAVTERKYKTIYIDPPWPERGGGKIKRGADAHYPVMTVRDIINLPVHRLMDPDGCHIYLWVTNNYLQAGLDCIQKWGGAVCYHYHLDERQDGFRSILPRHH